MATQINVAEAKAKLSELLDRALGGEEIVIARAGTPVVRLVAVEDARRRRGYGMFKGKIWMSPDFNELPDDVALAFGIDPKEERAARRAAEKKYRAKRKP